MIDFITSVTSNDVCLTGWGVYSDNANKTSVDTIRNILAGYPSSLMVNTITKKVNSSTCTYPIPTTTPVTVQNGESISKQLSLPSGYAILAPH